MDKLYVGNQLIEGIRANFWFGASDSELASAGNWHNAMKGLAMVLYDMKTRQPSRATEIRHLMASLWSLNYNPDTRTMLQRIHRGHHGPAADDKTTMPSHLMGQAACAMLWSAVLEAPECLGEQQSAVEHVLRQQFEFLVAGMVAQFFDEEHMLWRKESAADLVAPPEGSPRKALRFRAVDQALAILVLLRVIRLGGTPAVPVAEAYKLAWKTIHGLLDPPYASHDLYSFGFSSPSTATHYIDIAHPEKSVHVPERSGARLLWHDVWVAISLLACVDLEDTQRAMGFHAIPQPPEPLHPRCCSISRPVLADRCLGLLRQLQFTYLRKTALSQLPQVFVFSNTAPNPPCYVNDLALVHFLFRSVREEGIAPGGLLPQFDAFSRLIFAVIDRCVGIPIDFPASVPPARRESILSEIQELSAPPAVPPPPPSTDEGDSLHPAKDQASAAPMPVRGSPLPRVPMTPSSLPPDVGGAREDAMSPTLHAPVPRKTDLSRPAAAVAAGVAAVMPPSSVVSLVPGAGHVPAAPMSLMLPPVKESPEMVQAGLVPMSNIRPLICPAVAQALTQRYDLIPSSPQSQLLLHHFSSCPLHLGISSPAVLSGTFAVAPANLPPPQARRPSLGALPRGSPFPVLFRKTTLPSDEDSEGHKDARVIILQDPIVKPLPGTVDAAFQRCLFTNPLQTPNEPLSLGAGGRPAATLERRKSLGAVPAVVPASTIPAVPPAPVLLPSEHVITPAAVRPVLSGVPGSGPEDIEAKPALHANTETAFALLADIKWLKPILPSQNDDEEGLRGVGPEPLSAASTLGAAIPRRH